VCVYMSLFFLLSVPDRRGGKRRKSRLTFSYDCMLALRSERVMIFAGPCSPRFTADALVVSVNVGEGGPGEALRFPCGFAAIVKGRRGRGFGI
jgi:hypothetical protein